MAGRDRMTEQQWHELARSLHHMHALDLRYLISLAAAGYIVRRGEPCHSMMSAEPGLGVCVFATTQEPIAHHLQSLAMMFYGDDQGPATFSEDPIA